MKRKKILIMIITGLLLFTGCQTNSKIEKDQLKTEEVKVQETEVEETKKAIDEEVTEEEAKEIALNALENYFKEEIDSKNLEERIELIPDQTALNPYWMISWRPLDANKENMIVEYMANIDSKNGKILNISAVNIDTNKEIQKFDLQEAKNIAFDFIRENKLHNIDDIEFIKNTSGGEMYPQEDEGSYYLDFRYVKDKNKQIFICISKVEKKVFSYGVSKELIKD